MAAGKFTYRDGIAIIQLIAFGPLLLISLVSLLLGVRRHGFKAVFTRWWFVIALCLLRLLGASGQLATITYQNNSTLLTIVVVCNLVGLSPLLMMAFNLLREINLIIGLFPRIFDVLVLINLAGLILGIVGADEELSDSTSFHKSSLITAAISIYLALYAILIFLTVIFTFHLKHSKNMTYQQHDDTAAPSTKGDHFLLRPRPRLLAIAAAAPLLLVRLVYTALGEIAARPRFNPYAGNPTAYLCMDVLEEIAVTAIMVGVRAYVTKIEDEIPKSFSITQKSREQEDQSAGDVEAQTEMARNLHK